MQKLKKEKLHFGFSAGIRLHKSCQMLWNVSKRNVFKSYLTDESGVTTLIDKQADIVNTIWTGPPRCSEISQ